MEAGRVLVGTSHSSAHGGHTCALSTLVFFFSPPEKNFVFIHPLGFGAVYFDVLLSLDLSYNRNQQRDNCEASLHFRGRAVEFNQEIEQ